MAGFLTHYLFGMESCDILSDNYIREVIKNNNHAFLLGLQGNNLLSFNPHTLSKRGLSYRTASMTMRNQEYAAFFNNMLDTLSGMGDQERDICIAYMAGYLCFFAIDQSASPYILFRVWQDLPAKSTSSRMMSHRRKLETTIDTVLLRSRCHMEPSQLNFEALTFASRKDLSAIAYLMRQTIQTTYKYRIPMSEISNGVKNLRRQNIHIRPDAHFYHFLRYKIEGSFPLLPSRRAKIYQDYQSDEQDYMNTEKHPWYTYPGCPEASYLSFEEIFEQALQNSHQLLENLDSCLAWDMDREDLINSIIHMNPYPSI